MIEKKISKVLLVSALLILLSPISALADSTTDNSSIGGMTATNTSTQRPVTPSTNLSSAGYQVSQLAPAASPQLAAVGLGAVDQTITPDKGLFTTNDNVVNSEQQLPVNFTPGIIQYDRQDDRSAKINDQLTTQQMQTLNGYSDQWMNSLRHIWQSSPDHYSFHGQSYQAPNDLITPPSLFNTISQMAADRTRVHYGYDHTGDERIVLDATGDTAYGQYINQANLTPSEAVVHQIAPNATGTSFVVGENLYKLSGNTMLEAEVNLFNRMQDMLWGEATNSNGKLEGAYDHLANVLNPLFTHVAMGFQLVSPNHWYVTWNFEGLDNVDLLTGQQYFSNAERIKINQLWDQLLLLNKQVPTMINNHPSFVLINKVKYPMTIPNESTFLGKQTIKNFANLIINNLMINSAVLHQISINYRYNHTEQLVNTEVSMDKNQLLPATGNNNHLIVIGITLLTLITFAWLVELSAIIKRD